MRPTICLMYHNVFDAKAPAQVALFTEHFKALNQQFETVFPGESASGKRPAICLTFDDAYYDFYHIVYPLLQQWQMKALLAVPTTCIVEQCNVASEVRLNAISQELTQAYAPHASVPFCTWQELQTMVESGCVRVASHSHSHVDVTATSTDLNRELIYSQQLLTERLGVAVESFVFPYGKMDATVLAEAKAHYQYLIRIGGTCNYGWPTQRLIYRLDADPFWKQNKPVTLNLSHHFKWVSNYLRGK